MQLDRLGPYKIGKQIGKGGMGAVYEAVYDHAGPNSGLRVAIKALGPQLGVAEGFRERFEAEIESLKKLRHEGIIGLYGYGEQDGILFYSMELVEGTSLEEELNKGRRFNWQETLQIGVQVCRALKHAHDHGVVHRDIKPANLLLTPEGHVKIADFGIARLFGGTQLTTAGGVLGTADYMSPEQADGRPVTDKCDQYSLGGVMYALLAGRPPFKAKTMVEMLQLQRFADPEPVRRYAPETPDQLNRLIHQLLAKDPADRFPNVMVLGRHMEAMERALSRPLQSAAEPGDTKVGDPRLESAANHATAEVRDQATRAQPVPYDTKSEPVVTDIHEAATLAQPSDPGAIELEQAPPLRMEPLRSTFTTIDEDKRRQLELAGDSRWLLWAQLAALASVLSALVWGGWRLMRPASADELYATITATIDEEGDSDLRAVGGYLDEFAERFPNDPRNADLEPYRQQLEFQRFERQARVKARVAGAEASHPIGSLYLEAVRRAEENPTDALGMLQALVALYDPTDATRALDPAKLSQGELDADERWLLLARQKIDELRRDLNAQAKAQLPALRQRLEEAAALAKSHPDQARKMYEAIVRLYSDQSWAGEVVGRARDALAQFKSESAQ
jgi:serine/threonine-protein kinase